MNVGSTTDLESGSTERNGFGYDEGGTMNVIRILQSHLLSVLNPNVNLAASLFPEIYDLVYKLNTVTESTFAGARL